MEHTAPAINVVISSTFVAEPLRQSLETWLRELRIAATVSFAPYNQVFQQVLDPVSSIAANERGLNVILLRLSDWNGSHASSPESDRVTPRSELRQNVMDFVEALRQRERQFSSPTIVMTCPEVHVTDSAKTDDSIQEIEKLIISGLSGLGGVEVIPAGDLLMLYPLADCYDRQADALAHIPYNSLFYTSLATVIARRLHALKGPVYKVIALDCDGTLWDGVCGEDGPKGIRIDAIRRGLQTSMVAQNDQGKLICVCSSNNEQDVLDVFDSRDDMILGRNHIAAWKVNWKSKAENLESLSIELGLNLDSFVFIDDDPVVCAEVRVRCPEVLTLLLPQDPDVIPAFLKHIWAFDGRKLTTEDSERTRLYREHFIRESVRQEAPTLRDFIASLNLDIRISAASEHEVGRISELTLRTNQFNLSGAKQSEQEILQICGDGSRDCLAVHLKDRFGDYGLVGAAVLKASVDSIVVETFLLSCRALGRGVEHRMMAELGRIAKDRGKGFVDIRCIPTGKNKPSMDFVRAISADNGKSNGKEFNLRLAADVAASLSYDPEIRGMQDSSAVIASAHPKRGSDFFVSTSFVGSIPENLRDAELIHAWISQKQVRSNSLIDNSPPGSPNEDAIAAIYSELLGVTPIGIHDSFFDLGGHSLLAMRVLSRISQKFDVELDAILLFTTDFTVAELSSAVEKEQLRRLNPQDLDAILRQLAEITDEEAETLIHDEPGENV